MPPLKLCFFCQRVFKSKSNKLRWRFSYSNSVFVCLYHDWRYVHMCKSLMSETTFEARISDWQTVFHSISLTVQSTAAFITLWHFIHINNQTLCRVLMLQTEICDRNQRLKIERFFSRADRKQVNVKHCDVRSVLPTNLKCWHLLKCNNFKDILMYVCSTKHLYKPTF